VKADELVDRFYDGDTDEEQTRAAQALIAADPRSRARLERLSLLGSLVREVESERKLPADFTDRVMDGVLAQRSSKTRRSRRLPATALAAASALALAAAIGLWLRETGTPAAPSAALTGTTAAEGSPSAAVREAFEAEHLAEAPSVSIESVDFGATQGAIFLVSAGVTDTMVVWTLDEPAPHPSGPKR
jgi:anti-sigma factor RsiW